VAASAALGLEYGPSNLVHNISKWPRIKRGRAEWLGLVGVGKEGSGPGSGRLGNVHKKTSDRFEQSGAGGRQ